MKDQKLFDLNKNTSLTDDHNERDDRIRNNQQIHDYNITPYSSSNNDNYINSLSTAGIYQGVSKDTDGSKIDGDSNFRNGKMGQIMTSNKSKSSKLLDTTKFLNSPFLGSGETVLKYPDLKSKLLNGEDTFMPKSCDTLSGISIDRFTPLVPSLQENVQDTKHIIPEYWVRGGMSTRNVVRNIDYMRTCGLRK